MITQERLKQLVHYDPDTGKFTRLKVTRGAHIQAGNKRLDGYISLFIDGKAMSAHRMAWLYVHGTFPELYIDHINGDRSDNRIANLRQATRSENAQNIGSAYRNNKSSGILGVYPHACGKWQAKIQLNKKSRSLGLYHTKEEAAKAYQLAKAELHPFANRL